MQRAVRKILAPISAPPRRPFAMNVMPGLVFGGTCSKAEAQNHRVEPINDNKTSQRSNALTTGTETGR